MATTPEDQLVLLHTYVAGVWSKMSANERIGVRFGLFPAGVMRTVVEDGYDQHAVILALMDCAKSL